MPSVRHKGLVWVHPQPLREILMQVLVGDIGGTKTRLGVVELTRQPYEAQGERGYPSADFPHFEAILEQFRADSGGLPSQLCVGVAGPVRGQCCEVTSLPWRLEGSAMAHRLNLERVVLLNDLEAHAWGLGALGENDWQVLQTGTPDPRGNACLIAAGTGLGEAGLVWDGQRQRPFATEGGHASFAPGCEWDVELWRFLAARHGHVSWDRVVSGRGLWAIFECLLETRRARMPDWLAEAAQKTGDPAAAVSQAALAGRDELCDEALGHFVRLYGLETGNLALKMLATGGVHVGGGIAPKILPWLTDGRFLAAFRNQGRMTALMDSLPVRVLLSDRTALIGAAVFLATEASRS
ncbi:MAG: glucokinase [Pseudomonadota bacterium]